MSSVTTILRAAESIGYWEKLVPGFTITDTPVSGGLPDYEVTPAQRERITRQVVEEGYFNLEPVLPATDVQSIAAAIQAVVGVGLPPVFCFVYDEVWKIFARLNQVLEPILDPGFRFQTAGIWGWCIDRQSAGFGPHRDLTKLYLEPDGRPSSLTIWIPFTDATPLNGCMYVLPTSMDPNYPGNLESRQIDDVQCVRALPAKAGSVLGWTSNIVHWGARSSHFAVKPRISIGVSFNRADKQEQAEHAEDDYSLGTELVAGLDTAIPFSDRLNFIGAAIWIYRGRVVEIFPDIAAALFDYCRDHYVSPGQPAAVDAEAIGILTRNRKIIAQRLYKAGRHTDAQIAMQQLCEDYPKDADAWQRRGHLEILMNELDTAEACFKQAIALQDDLPDVHKGLAKVLDLKRRNV